MPSRVRPARNRAEADAYIERLIIPLIERVGLTVQVERGKGKPLGGGEAILRIKLPR